MSESEVQALTIMIQDLGQLVKTEFGHNQRAHDNLFRFLGKLEGEVDENTAFRNQNEESLPDMKKAITANTNFRNKWLGVLVTGTLVFQVAAIIVGVLL